MRRKLAIGALTLLSLILLVVVAVIVYVRSGKLDIYLQTEVVSALADVGIRAEIGSSNLDLRGYRVTLRDIKLYKGEHTDPLATIESLTGEFSVISYLKQQIKITRIEVVHPQISIISDAKGHFNFEGLHSPPERKPKEKGDVSIFGATVEIKQAELTFAYPMQDVTAHIIDLNASFVPRDPASPKDELDHVVEVAFSNATATYEGRQIQNISSHLRATVTEKNAEIEQFNLASDLASVSAALKISAIRPVTYESTSDVRIDADLDRIARVFLPGTQSGGKVSFTGRVDGAGMDYHLQGGVESDRILAEGFNIAGLRVKTRLTGSGAEYRASADLTSGAVTGRGLKISSINVRDGLVKGQEGRFDVTGALNLASLEGGSVTVSGFRGEIVADRQRFGFSQFTAGVLGGQVTGSASVDYSRGPSRVDAQFESIALDQAATLAAARQVKVAGTARGSAHLQFPGFNYKAATGRVEASFDGSLAPAKPDAQPASFKGELSLAGSGQGFEIERAAFQSVKSDLVVTGSIGWDGLASLGVRFKSRDMAELQRAIESFDLIPQSVRDEHPFGLAGEGQFEGRVEGRLQEPTVSGRLKLASIEVRNRESVSLDKPSEQQTPVEAGAFEGDISYTPSLVRVDNASLVRSDGSRADFSINAPLDTKDSISVKATLQNLDLPMLVRAASQGEIELATRGAISGTIDLKGLPGPRSIQGTAKVTLTAAEFNIVSPEVEKPDTRVSVPEFAGDVTFANSVVSVENMRMKVGDADVKGTGSFNLDTYAYSVNADGRNIDLSQVSDTFNGPKLAGTADVTVNGQGKLGKSADWSELNLNATIQGHNVTLNGRELGDAKIVAVTDNGIMKIEASGKLLDQPRSLDATIDLRDSDNYPIASSIEFTDADIGPYLGLLAPQLGNISGRSTGSIKLSGPLQRTDELTGVATLTKLEFGGAISDRLRYSIANQANVVITGTVNKVTLDPVTFVGEGTSVKLGGSLEKGGASSSKLGIEGEVNLRLLSSFTETVFTTGIARVQAQIGGSLDSPELLGVMKLQDVGVRLLNFPLSVAHGNGQIRFTSNQALVEDFKATTPGGGSIAIAGGAALSGLVPDAWRLETKADQIAGEYPRDTQTTVDATLVLQGKRGFQQVLSGHAEVRRAAYTRNITIEELIRTGGPFSPEALEAGPGGSGGTSALQTVLDLRITADNTLIVKNNLADAVGSAYLNMRGSIDNPIVSGRILLNQGTLEFRNGRYEITRGMITIPPQHHSEPILDFQTEATISGTRVTIAFNGPGSKLHTTVTSDPELPEADIISLILTGSVSSDRSTAAAVRQTGLGLAQSILSASLSEQLERGTQRLFGLSRFSIDPLLVGRGTDPTARITIGQRITKDLTVTYSQNLTSGVSGVEQVVLIEYRLSNRYSIVGSRNENGELGFDFRLHKRF